MYRDPQAAMEEIPTLQMICQTYESLSIKAERLFDLVKSLNSDRFSIELMDGASKVGGGALPLQELKSRLLCLIPGSLSSQRIEAWLRSFSPPVITRLERDRVMLDLRTIQESDA